MDFSPFWVSIKTALTATFVTFFSGMAAAWFISNYKGKLKGVIDVLLMMPMVLPPTVVGFVLLIAFGINGSIGKILNTLGIHVVFSWSATVIAAAVVAFPLMYKSARGAFEQIDGNIVNAARTLGVTEWRIFCKVVIPLAWPGIAAGIALTFARALGEFGATIMIAGNIPGKTQTIPVAIFFAAEGGEMGKALILVVIISFVSFAAMTLINYWMEYKMKIRSVTRSVTGRQ